MLKVLLLIMTVIVGVLGYKVYSDNYATNQTSTTKASMTVVEKESLLHKGNQAVENRPQDVENNSNQEIIAVTQEGEKNEETGNKEEEEIGKRYVNRSYEEIENDTSLSEEDKEIAIMDKLAYDATHMEIFPQKALSEAEIEQMIIDNLSVMEEIEKNK